jgi:nucleotide-binding universal stress UspA family protein
VETARYGFGTDGRAGILVGVDGSKTSLRAAAYAAGLARRQGAKLIVLFVKAAPGMSVVAPDAAIAMDQTLDQLALDLRREFEENAPRLGLHTEFVVRAGNPYAELRRVAEERKVDAIVVGASKRAGQRFVGSLATKLVRQAAWPVAVVP